MKSSNFVESENLVILILLKFQSFSSKAKKYNSCLLLLRFFEKSHEIPKYTTFATTEKLSWQQESSETVISKDTNSLIGNDQKT